MLREVDTSLQFVCFIVKEVHHFMCTIRHNYFTVTVVEYMVTHLIFSRNILIQKTQFLTLQSLLLERGGVHGKDCEGNHLRAWYLNVNGKFECIPFLTTGLRQVVQTKKGCLVRIDISRNSCLAEVIEQGGRAVCSTPFIFAR